MSNIAEDGKGSDVEYDAELIFIVCKKDGKFSMQKELQLL